jgi:hypothetical protein
MDCNIKRKNYLDQRYYCKQLSAILRLIANDYANETEEVKRAIEEENRKNMLAAIDECRARHFEYIEFKEYFEMLLLQYSRNK